MKAFGKKIQGVFMNDPLFFLYQDDYGTYSRSMARHLKSVNAAILLSELSQSRKYHSDRGQLISDAKHGEGWFYLTHEKVEERTALGRKEQDTALKILKDHGLIEHINFGMPARRHFILNDDKILEFYKLSRKDYSLPLSGKPVCPFRAIPSYNEPYNNPVVVSNERGDRADGATASKQNQSFVKSDLYYANEKFRKGWSVEEIETCFKALCSSQNEVSNVIAYADGVVAKLRTQNKPKSKTKSITPKEKLCQTNQPLSPHKMTGYEILQETQANERRKFLERGTGTNILETFMQQDQMKFNKK